MSNESLILGLAVFLVIFIICRELVCWYWKINKSVALLTEIRDLLISLNEAQAKPGNSDTPHAV